MWRLGLDLTLLHQQYSLFHSLLSNIICSIIYTFNMIISAFEIFLFRAYTGLYKPVQAPTRKLWEYWC
jgi:hypothetical protein